MDFILLCCTYNKAGLVSVMQCAYGMGSSSILQICVLHVLIIIIIIITNDGWLGGGLNLQYTHTRVTTAVEVEVEVMW